MSGGHSVMLIVPKKITDERGWFAEVYSAKRLTALGIEARFVQDNQSLSHSIGTLRGLHFQRPPHAQAKLVQCTRGRIFDVSVDIRRGSPTYGKWVGAEISAANGRQIFIPVGFLHGFMTLELDTEVTYKVSDFYVPQSEGGVRWDDASIDIQWPLPEGISPILSAKDKKLPVLEQFQSPFVYDGHPMLPLELPSP